MWNNVSTFSKTYWNNFNNKIDLQQFMEIFKNISIFSIICGNIQTDFQQFMEIFKNISIFSITCGNFLKIYGDFLQFIEIFKQNIPIFSTICGNNRNWFSTIYGNLWIFQHFLQVAENAMKFIMIFCNLYKIFTF